MPQGSSYYLQWNFSLTWEKDKNSCQRSTYFKPVQSRWAMLCSRLAILRQTKQQLLSPHTCTQMIFNYCFKSDYKNQQSTVIALCCLRFSELQPITRYNFIRTMTTKRLPFHVTFKTTQLASVWQNYTQVAVYWEENLQLELLIFCCSSCPAT